MRTRRTGKRSAGQVMTEYILIIVIVSLALALPVYLLSDSMKDFLDRSREALCTIAKGSPGSDPP